MKEQVKHNERRIKMDGLGELKMQDQKKHPGTLAENNVVKWICSPWLSGTELLQ